MSVSVSFDPGGYFLPVRSPRSSAFRDTVCFVLLLFPRSIFAADSNAAMIYVNGAAAVNNSRVPHPSEAILPGDLLQTGINSAVNINRPGCIVTVLADSLVQYQGTAVGIRHGSVTVSTSGRMATITGDVRVSPAANVWTEFDVADTAGTVKIAARKGNLTTDDGHKVVTLAQGQEMTRDESNPFDNASKKRKNTWKQTQGTSPAAKGPALSSRVAIGLGAGADVAVTTWVLVKNDRPASPSKP